MGIVWLYRPNSDRSNLSPTIYLLQATGSRKLARLDKGQFFGIQLSAGNHAFSWTNAPTQGEQIVIALEPGQQAYVEVNFRSIARVDRKVVDTRSLRPVDSNNVFDSAVIAPAQGIRIAEAAAVPGSQIASSIAPVPTASVAQTPASAATTVVEKVPAQQKQPAALTNSEITNLVKSQLSADVITTLIHSSKTNFDTTPAALSELKAAKVPDAVILAMVQAATTEGPKPIERKESWEENQPRLSVRTGAYFRAGYDLASENRSSFTNLVVFGRARLYSKLRQEIS